MCSLYDPCCYLSKCNPLRGTSGKNRLPLVVLPDVTSEATQTIHKAIIRNTSVTLECILPFLVSISANVLKSVKKNLVTLT